MRLDNAQHGTTATNGPPTPVAPRRRPRPSGRAALGGLLVAVGVLGAFALATRSEGQLPHRAVVAVGDVRPGARLSADQLRLAPLHLPDDTAGQAFTSVEELDGAVALAPLAPGELVQRSAVLPAAQPAGAGEGPGGHELTLALEPERAAGGTLRPGERVDVLATYGTGADATTTSVARDALVRAVDEAGGRGLAASGTVALTLSVPSRQEVMRLAHASEVGAVVVVRTTRAAGADPGPDTYRVPTPR